MPKSVLVAPYRDLDDGSLILALVLTEQMPVPTASQRPGVDQEPELDTTRRHLLEKRRLLGRAGRSTNRVAL